MIDTNTLEVYKVRGMRTTRGVETSGVRHVTLRPQGIFERIERVFAKMSLWQVIVMAIFTILVIFEIVDTFFYIIE